MTLYQTLEASMDITSDLPASAVCDVFIAALTLDGFNATCTAAVSGEKYTFALKYPLEPAERVADKTAEAKALIVAADFPDKMAAAAANLFQLTPNGLNAANGQVGRRLNVLSVDADSVTAWFSSVPSECAPARPQPGSLALRTRLAALDARLAAAWAASCEPPEGRYKADVRLHRPADQAQACSLRPPPSTRKSRSPHRCWRVSRTPSQPCRTRAARSRPRRAPSTPP